ncbi:protein spalt-accessory [Drosophila santomea]|uniref:protein spalt-accessory n=1 Tax=Drosophila santomea TaxID=129105 RepID=UPI00195316DB|nr:protein spalt-accessory [Drosophila santomea]
MKLLIVLLALVAAVLARPQIGGYGQGEFGGPFGQGGFGGQYGPEGYGGQGGFNGRYGSEHIHHHHHRERY